MNIKNILLIAGTRPNFVKLAPLYHRLKKETYHNIFICHTGQHYDKNMSDSFFECLELPTPDFILNVRGSNVPETIGKTIIAVNEVLLANSFNLVIVFGDVNATVAGAISAVQSGIKLMHVEAGLRSFDKRMPEEVNRVLTDSIADYLMVSEESGLINLYKEGYPQEKIHYVGNIMIEALISTMPKWKKIKFNNDIDEVKKYSYALATFHRPENVDDQVRLKKIVDILIETAKSFHVIFPIHPRTKIKLIEFDLYNIINNNENIYLNEPLGYFEFLNLISEARFVMTDSGGIQEETTYLKVPCITFRNNTERPSTIKEGTNVLINVMSEFTLDGLLEKVEVLKYSNKSPIKFWDAEVSKRILQQINNSLSNN